MKGLKLLLVVGVTVATLSGCAPWTRIEDPYVLAPDKTFTVQAPVGWMRNNMRGDRVFVTKDGGFQFIEAAHRKPDKAFMQVMKPSSGDMLPTELAELAIADLKADGDWEALEVVSNKPAMLDGRPAFRLHVRRKTTKGLRVERVMYGMADDSGYYVVAYEAPNLHYFGRDITAFEAVVKSFKLSS